MKKLYFTVYKTTNLANGKIYIGKHITEDPYDRYLGSGQLFYKALQKYGVKNFKKEILFIFDNEKEMLDKERELVNEEFVKDDSNYNLIVGGTGNYNRLHGNFGTNNKLAELNSKSWIWICNPSIGIKKRSWNAELSQEEIDAGWEYGTLSEANFIQVEHDGEKISLKMLAHNFNLDCHLMLLRYKAKWSIEELLTIPENLLLYKNEQQQLLAKKTIKKQRRITLKQNTIHQQKTLANERYDEFVRIGQKAFQQKYSKKERKYLYKLFRMYISNYTPLAGGSCGKKIMVNYNGKSQPLNKWISELDLQHSAVYLLHSKGIDFAKIFSILVGHPRRRIDCSNDLQQSQISVAREYLKHMSNKDSIV